MTYRRYSLWECLTNITAITFGEATRVDTLVFPHKVFYGLISKTTTAFQSL